ncbi:hypothetical protein AB0I81_50650, partial [Nonomuraea sp. NPDC050404]|uniref:hypothetical protein n=1 Tax=Nonomuraea sp. NPDC050404 TaxID=3155783 RepID=UPI0033D0537D
MLEIGDVVAMPLPLGGWGACQVTALRNRLLVVCTLAWHSASPPTLDDLREAGPLVLDHHSWDGGPMAASVDADEPLPADFVLLGPLPVLPGLPRECDRLGSWDGEAMQVVLQRHWDLRLPDQVKAAYKGAPAGLVEVDLGGGPPLRKAARLARLDLRERRGDVRWAGLDSLSHVTGLLWAGAERGLVEALESRPMITDLVWEDPPGGDVDLSRTGLHELTLRGLAAPRRLTLPPGLMRLGLAGGSPEAVTAELDGRWIRLATSGVRVPEGLRGVRALEVEVAGDLPGAAVAGLEELESLRVRWTGPYGGLDGLSGPDEL